MTTASISAHSQPQRRPVPFGVLETGAVVVGTLYLLSPWRTLAGDVGTFVLGIVLVLALGLGVRPANPSSRPLPWILGALAATAVVAGAIVLMGLAISAPALQPGWFLLTLGLYLPSAWMQQFLTQRYVVGRLCRRLGGRSDAVTITAGAAMFAVCHLPLPGLVLPCFLSALVWNWIYLRSGHLWPIVLSHAVLGTSYFLVALGGPPFTDLGLH